MQVGHGDAVLRFIKAAVELLRKVGASEPFAKLVPEEGVGRVARL
jgi:hypothetical protein